MSRCRPDIGGVVLAGGRSRRMGGADKALLRVGGKTLLARTIEALRPQVGPLVISTGNDQISRAVTGLPVVADPRPDGAGPLAGILAGLEWLGKTSPRCCWLVSVPVDAPLFPADLVFRLVAAAEAGGCELALACSNGRTHPVFGLWSVALTEALRRAVIEEDLRKVERWTGRYRLATVEWCSQPYDPFLNVNTPQELAQLRAVLLASADF